MQSLMPQSQFAGCSVIRRLGGGGMGEVHLVRNPALNREEALKVTPLGDDVNAARRFANEASTMAAFDHPNIATIYSFGVTGDCSWYTMRYLPGTDLGTVSPLPREDAVTVILQIGAALDYAHAHGVVHRDVKPSNIHLRFRDDQSVAKATLLDFGVAKGGDRTAFTEVNSFVGTLGYSAPEAIGGDTSHPSIDQYSLACTAFEALTGNRPFAAETLTALIAAHASAPIPRISVHDPRLRRADPVFERALAKDPAERYPSCGEFSRALACALQPGRTERVTGDRHVSPAAPATGSSGPTPIPHAAMAHPRSADSGPVAHPAPSGPVHIAPVPTPSPVAWPQPSRRAVDPGIFRRRRRIAVAGLVALVLVAAAGLWVVRSTSQSSGADSSSSEAQPDESAASTSDGSGVAVVRNDEAGDAEPGRYATAAPSDPGEATGTWGLAVDEDGNTYAFRDFADHRAIITYATDTWGYSPRTWGLVYFTSGCAAFAAPEFPGEDEVTYEYGLGHSRPDSEAAAITKSENTSGLRSHVVDTVCVGDLIQ